MIYESIIFLHLLLPFRTVYRTMSSTLTVNLFKARLDRFWMNQDVKYDFTADLTGTGDRSEYTNKYSAVAETGRPWPQ